MTLWSIRSLVGIPGCVLLLTFTGCSGSDGPARASASGTVSYNGELVGEGSITFIPAQGPSAGGKIEDGKFSIESEMGPVVGENTVSVYGVKKSGRKLQLGTREFDEKKPFIPKEFQDNSNYTVTIVPGENELEIVLEN